MAPRPPHALAQQARRYYLDVLERDAPATLAAVVEGARSLALAAADPAIHAKRRDAAMDLPRHLPAWQQHMADRIRQAKAALALPRSGPEPVFSRPKTGKPDLTLVDDDTIEHDILASRLGLAISDRTSWQFTDLRARLSAQDATTDFGSQDPVLPQSLAAWVLDAWLAASLPLDHWRTLQSVLHEESGALAESSYHEANRWLLEQGVRPEIDLRPFIRRSRTAVPATIPGALSPASGTASRSGFATTSTSGATSPGSTSAAGSGGAGGGGVNSPPARASAPGAPGSRPAPRTPQQDNRSPVQQHADVVLSQLSQMMSKHLTDYGTIAGGHPRPASPALGAAINQAQAQISKRYQQQGDGTAALSAPALLEELQRNKQSLKQAATTQVERATIEVVALMFQSILTDERVPAAMRVWFARLQMPVLRVAVGEPDFFANVSHPARQLIDRMGSCVMGFDVSTRSVGDALEREIKRIVQVVEAYPDTGRRVFQTVLTEFERFLKHYFQSENEATRRGISLAQQVEQRETLAIQYTIELRKMLNEVPVQEGVRDFLFHTWADVLATTAVRFGPTSEATKAMKKAAADLIWSASAKVSREERAEVIRRLPPLLKSLRDGMAQAGMAADKQEEHIQALNNSLAAAFTAKAASISNEHLAQLMARLQTLDEILPDAANIELDQDTIMDLSGYETADLEVVSGGGSTPTPGMVQWAQQLLVGSWYQLDYRNRVEPVQLAWQGSRKQLALFATPNGRGVLFQIHRLAAFLQAGLLVPAEDESLTTRATRQALAKLDADPQRLMT